MAAEAWHCESPGEAIVQGASQAPIEVLGLKGSCKEIEA